MAAVAKKTRGLHRSEHRRAVKGVFGGSVQGVPVTSRTARWTWQEGRSLQEVVIALKGKLPKGMEKFAHVEKLKWGGGYKGGGRFWMGGFPQGK